MRSVVLAFAVTACGSNEPAHAPVAEPPAPQAATAPPPAKHVLRPHREDAVVECPVSPTEGDDEAKAAVLLEAANKQIVAATYAAAWTCADRAADLAPS
jgi:hypothetical protein